MDRDRKESDRQKGSKSKNNTEQSRKGELSVSHKKTLNFKTTEKIYKVTILYVEISEEEQKLKRSILEGIIRDDYLSRAR